MSLLGFLQSGKVTLSPDLLDILRDYWREAQLAGWLFPGKPKINPISARQLSWAVNSAKHLLEANTPSGHCFAIAYTHRVAISNSRLISADANTVTFKWKNYRVKPGDKRSCFDEVMKELKVKYKA